MRALRLCSVLAGISLSAFGQGRTVAITVDDLPYVSGGQAGADLLSTAESVNRGLLAAFQAHHIPVTGFVIQKTVESLGPVTASAILKDWISQRLRPRKSPSYSHPDINGLSVEQIEEEIVRGESMLAPLLKESGKKLSYFRFPMNHTGDTKEKHDAVAAFLTQRGYRPTSDLYHR